MLYQFSSNCSLKMHSEVSFSYTKEEHRKISQGITIYKSTLTKENDKQDVLMS